MSLLEVSNLRTYFKTDAGEARAVDGISFGLERSEVLGIVGESGSGKSVTSLSLMRLIPDPPGRIMEGSSIRFKGEELTTVSDSRMRELRGSAMAMIFQEPMTSLNPVHRVGEQIAEAVRKMQFQAFAASQMFGWQDSFSQHERGLLDDDIWRHMRASVDSAMRHPAFREAYEQRFSHSPATGPRSSRCDTASPLL